MDNTTQARLTPAQKRAATLAAKRARNALVATAMGCDCTMCDVPTNHIALRDEGADLRTYTFGIVHADGEAGDEIDVLWPRGDSAGAISHANDIAQEVYENVARLQPLATGGSGGWVTVYS